MNKKTVDASQEETRAGRVDKLLAKLVIEFSAVVTIVKKSGLEQVEMIELLLEALKHFKQDKTNDLLMLSLQFHQKPMTFADKNTELHEKKGKIEIASFIPLQSRFLGMLVRHGVCNVVDLIKQSADDLLEINGLTKDNIPLIITQLALFGLKLGMTEKEVADFFK